MKDSAKPGPRESEGRIAYAISKTAAGILCHEPERAPSRSVGKFKSVTAALSVCEDDD
jgi:hypothetical protein